MSRALRVAEHAIREMVESAFDSGVLSGGDPTIPTEPVPVNPLVDLTTASTDPSSPSWAPQTKAEFSVALGRMLDGISDEEMPGLYKQIKAALAEIDDVEGTENMRVKNGSGDTQLETIIRRRIRRMIAEAMPGRDLGFSGPDTYALSEFDDEPWKVYRVVKGKRKRDPEASYDTKNEAEQWAARLRRQFSSDEFVVVDESPHSDDDDDREKGEWSVPKGSEGLDFSQIAKEMGMSVMGAQALAARAMKRFGHMRQMMFGDMDEEGADPEAAEILVLSAVKDFLTDLNDDRKSQKIIDSLSGKDMKALLPDSMEAYVEFLTSSGELPAADVQFLKDHQGVAETLEGYPEFVRTELLGDLQAEFADLPNDVDRLTNLDAFREYMSKYVKRSIRKNGGDDGMDENTRRRTPRLFESRRPRRRGSFSRVIAEAAQGGTSRAPLRSRDPAEVAHGIVAFLSKLGRNVRASAKQRGDKWIVTVSEPGKFRGTQRPRDNDAIADLVSDELMAAGFDDGRPIAVHIFNEMDLIVSFKEHDRDPDGAGAAITVWAQPTED